MAHLLKRGYEILALGKYNQSDSPKPATMNTALVFLGSANLLNILYGLALYLPSLSPLRPDVANTGTLAIIGYYLNIAGILASLPATAIGASELAALIKEKGLYVKTKANQEFQPAVKVAAIHAGLHDFLVVGAIYNWLMEVGRSFEDYRPYGHQVLLSAGAMGVVLGLAVTGYLGGSVVYGNGRGVDWVDPAIKKVNAKKEELKKKA